MCKYTGIAFLPDLNLFIHFHFFVQAKKPVHRVKYILSGMRALVSFDSASSTGNGSGGQIEGPETVGDTIEEENNIGEHEDVNLLPGLRT